MLSKLNCIWGCFGGNSAEREALISHKQGGVQDENNLSYLHSEPANSHVSQFIADEREQSSNFQQSMSPDQPFLSRYAVSIPNQTPSATNYAESLKENPDGEMSRIVQTQDKRALEAICNEDLSLINNPEYQNEDGQCLLQLMIQSKWFDGIGYVLELDDIASVINDTKDSDLQPLVLLTKMLATNNNDSETAKLVEFVARMLDLGVDPNGYNTLTINHQKVWSDSQKTPSTGRSPDVSTIAAAKKFLYRKELNIRGRVKSCTLKKRATTPIVHLCENIRAEHVPLIKKFIEKGADANTSVIAKSNASALTVALKFLNGVEEQSCDKGNSKLEVVFEVIDLLLSAGAEFDSSSQTQADYIEPYGLDRWDKIKAEHNLSYTQPSKCLSNESTKVTREDGTTYYDIRSKKRNTNYT